MLIITTTMTTTTTMTKGPPTKTKRIKIELLLIKKYILVFGIIYVLVQIPANLKRFNGLPYDGFLYNYL